tara:strand:+ start:364 stop:669 length:306 start_codon:yes stop_codon:yes gene_type:complete
MTISDYLARCKDIIDDDSLSDEDFEKCLEEMRYMFKKVGNPPISNRLQLIKDKIESPSTNDKVRWEFLMFLMEQYTPSWDIDKWLIRLEDITERYVNDARN